MSILIDLGFKMFDMGENLSWKMFDKTTYSVIMFGVWPLYMTFEIRFAYTFNTSDGNI